MLGLLVEYHADVTAKDNGDDAEYLLTCLPRTCCQLGELCKPSMIVASRYALCASPCIVCIALCIVCIALCIVACALQQLTACCYRSLRKHGVELGGESSTRAGNRLIVAAFQIYQNKPDCARILLSEYGADISIVSQIAGKETSLQ